MVRERRTEGFQHVELRVQSVGVIQVIHIFALPSKRFSPSAFEPRQINLSTPQKFDVLFWKVFSDDGNQVDVGKKTCSR